VDEYAGLLGRACPAAVYEYIDAEGEDGKVENVTASGKKFVINAQVRRSSRSLGVGLIGRDRCRPLELHPLQIMRYQGSNSGHHLERTRRRWGS
jgi:electron-transferring-flavoprotein dehydrogenase